MSLLRPGVEFNHMRKQVKLRWPTVQEVLVTVACKDTSAESKWSASGGVTIRLYFVVLLAILVSTTQ